MSAAERLFGRARELSELDLAVRAGALVTVVGPGGVGKTRLARELVMRAAPRFEGRASLADLSRARNVSELFEALAQALGLPRRAELGDDADRVAHVLGARGPCLLVLDNFEQLMESAAVLAAWRRSVPDMALLVTSREPLAIDGERLLAIDPLAEGDALELMRARASHPITDEAAARATLSLLGCLPLAIEMAAAMLDVLSPAQLRLRLEGGVGTLESPRRDVPERHRSLAAAIRWSWDLLDETERRVLALSTAFDQPFTNEDAAGVMGGDVLPALLGLRRKCLLVAHAGPQVRLEIQSVAVRELAAEHLRALELEDAAIQAHAAHFLTRAQAEAARLLGPHDQEALAWLRQHVAEIVALARRDPDPDRGARAILALDPALALDGPRALHEELLDRAVERVRDPALQARVLLARAEQHWRHGRLSESELDAERALHHDEGATRGQALRILSRHAQVRGDQALAQARFEQAQACFESIGAPAQIAMTLGSAGALATTRGDHARALELFEQALEIFRRIPVPRLVARHLSLEGLVMTSQRRLAPALATFERALALHEELGDRTAAAIDLTMVGFCLANQGALGEALPRLERAVALQVEVGNMRFEAVARTLLGWLLLELARVDDAEHELTLALALHRRVGDPRYIGDTILGLAWCSRARGALERARELAGEAIEILTLDPELECFALALALSLDLALERGTDLGLRLSARMASVLRPTDAQFELARPAYEALIALARASRGEAEMVSARAARARFLAPPGEPIDRVSGHLRRLRAVLDDLVGDLEGLRLDERAQQAQLGVVAIDLSRRTALWNLLAALARQHRSAPGHALGATELVGAGWPGERMIESAALARLRTAIRSLRELGLRDLIVTRGSGYLLAPTARVHWQA